MSFATRIALTSLTLALLTLLVIWLGPPSRDVTVVARSPNGAAVPVGTAIRITFSRPVDRAAVEQNLVFSPAVTGRSFWEGQTLTFRPMQPLTPQTIYTITLEAGLRDQRGRPNANAISWSFHTRSPRLLLLTAAAEGGNTLLLTAPDGSESRPVLSEPGGILGLAVAPDGQQAVAVVRHHPQRNALLLVNLEDGSTRPLIDEPDASASAPAWSPAGNIIAFERRTLSNDTATPPIVWLAQPDGTSLGPIFSSAQVSSAPAWAPDGSRLAFVTGAAGEWQEIGIYDFTRAQRTFPESSGAAASWAPGGTALVYTSRPPGAEGRTAISQIDLQTEQLFILTSGASDSSPQWSSDGQWIVFVRRPTPEGRGVLWLMRGDGSSPRQLTNPTDAEDSQPAWSPDSRQVAFVRHSPGGSSVWLVDITTGQVQPVHEGAQGMVWVP